MFPCRLFMESFTSSPPPSLFLVFILTFIILFSSSSSSHHPLPPPLNPSLEPPLELADLFPGLDTQADGEGGMLFPVHLVNNDNGTIKQGIQPGCRIQTNTQDCAYFLQPGPRSVLCCLSNSYGHCLALVVKAAQTDLGPDYISCNNTGRDCRVF